MSVIEANATMEAIIKSKTRNATVDTAWGMLADLVEEFLAAIDESGLLSLEEESERSQYKGLVLSLIAPTDDDHHQAVIMQVGSGAGILNAMDTLLDKDENLRGALLAQMMKEFIGKSYHHLNAMDKATDLIESLRTDLEQ